MATSVQDTSVQDTNQLILSGCISRNEAFSLIIASNLLAFAVNCLEKDFSSRFSFSVLPVVYPVQTEHRKDKESDLVTVRIRNKRTIVVIELKSAVSAGLGDRDKDPLSQLFYEMYLVCQEEGKNYKDLIGIYGNYCTWHLFLVDCSVLETEIKRYAVLSYPEPITLYSTLKYFHDQFE